MSQTKRKVGIIGATGMVGQRFITLLKDHPWFEVVLVAASPQSAGKTYQSAVEGRWCMSDPIPPQVASLKVYDASDISLIAPQVDFVFSAVDMKKEAILALEEAYAKAEIPVVSNNSAHRNTFDVPMMIPEVNPHHADIIPYQRKRLGTRKGFIAVKPNCSIQSYVPALEPLMKYGIKSIQVTTFQAISGAGKTFESWPEMIDNVIPYIGGEEEKTEKEPLKIWGKMENGKIIPCQINISAQCIRVPVSDGHLAAVSVLLENPPSLEEIKKEWDLFEGEPQKLKLPLAPEKALTYFEEENRPQTRLDRDLYRGMGLTLGRLRQDSLMSLKFVALSHNTIRGAAGGAILTAELLCAKNYL